MTYTVKRNGVPSYTVSFTLGFVVPNPILFNPLANAFEQGFGDVDNQMTMEISIFWVFPM